MNVRTLLQESSASHVRGDLASAARGYDEILAAEPDHADALFLSGTLHAQRGEWDAARARLRRLLAAHPGHAEGWLNLAHVLERSGSTAEAIECYDAYLRLRPADAQTWFNLGLIAFQAKRFDDAARAYQAYVDRVPDSVEGHFNLGATLHDMHRLEAAQRQYERVLQLDPRQVEAHRGLGNIALHERRYQAAAEHFRQALALAPQDVEALSNLGVMLQKLGCLGEAEEALRAAVRIAPDHVNAHFNLGLVLLLQGRFREGWQEYEWRHRIKSRTPTRFTQPEWNGSPLHGKTLLLRTEQGFGDTFQFVRYGPLLQAQGARVVLECQPGLKRVLLRTPGIDMISERPASGQPLVEFDLHVPLLSLPRLFDTDAHNVPEAFPYIHPEPWLARRWAARLAGDGNFRVGIVWAGRPTHEDDRSRSCSLNDFLALASVSGVTLYSLQKGDALRQLAAPEVASRVVDLDPEIDDFADTAAAIANLDLVICVDTSVAHLAGAMGKPVWIVLPFAPDWRWLAAGEDNPWYPSARLFRQAANGEWGGVFARVREQLAAVARDRPAGGHPAPAEPPYDAALVAQMREARRALRRSDWAGAEAHCAAALASPAGQAEIHWLMGFAQFSLGRTEDALGALAAAYERWPRHAPLLKILGMALQTLDQRPEAEQCYQGALQYGNDDPEVLFNLGVLKHLDGQIETAAQLYDTAIALKPEFPDCLNNLGIALRSLGRTDEAIARFRDAIAIRSDFFDSLLNLGNTVYATGDAAAALDWFRRAAALRADHAGAHNGLGVALKALGHLDAALEALRRAVTLDPQSAEARANLGNALKQAGHLPEAVAAYRAALTLDPNNALTWSNLGSALHRSGAMTDALAAFEQALVLDPALPEAHWNRALVWLALGDYARGWAEYEWGFAAGARPLPARDIPAWHGETLADRGLLVSVEQGFGDAIQFVRFVRRLRPRVGKIVLECPPALTDLLRTCAGVDRVVTPEVPDAALPEVAARVALMSVPAVLGMGRPEPEEARPYLAVDEARLARFTSRIGTAGFRTGLVWAGSPAHQDDRSRSCPPALLQRLLSVPGTRFFSLQKGRAPTEAMLLGSELEDLGPALEDFADTAAAIACLDLVIAVDTAVAHLAGALGKPVWILLPFAADWRWGQEGETTPWYPSARLFRQRRPDDWEGVLDTVRHALDAFLAERP